MRVERMEFISADKILKQPKEVQEVFMEWWKPSVGDLIFKRATGFMTFVRDSNENVVLLNGYSYRIKGFKDTYIPLFTEGQLRKFIEDKTDNTMDLKLNVWKYENKNVTRIDIQYNHFNKNFGFKIYGNTLQAYWKAACEIAKESVENE
jgi:hypothetical protein